MGIFVCPSGHSLRSRETPTPFFEIPSYLLNMNKNIIITEKQLETIINNNEDKIIYHIKKLINTIEMEGICDVDVSKDEDEVMYSVYLVINPKWYLTNKSWIDKDKKNVSINKTKTEIYTKFNSYLNLTNVYVGSYVNPDNC